ncbi:hypothetical protein FAY30_12505 [Bacillus sp. S3]|uniref:hypothetical protein n=1 Tax=Bacillus sp. S3 TaxID=486398 RepID=UPI00118CD6BF|nr:hypothetical protein [Bacillus sp. S3]QCJ42664.1 hypothetical protein FAY30_12505 [Bacillus sp. S3]
MRRFTSLFIVLMIILTGCRSSPFGQHVQIDWVDFIKWNGKTYDGIYNGALADAKYIGEKLGEVKFKVADHVTDPEYKLKNGDAAFHDKGTGIYAIKEEPHLIAVKSARAINGYQIYFSRDDLRNQLQFQDMPMEKVSRIEIFQAYTDTPKPIAVITQPKVSQFLQLLNNSQAAPNFEPNTENGDPVYNHMVFYTGDAIAYMYDINFDGHTYFWHPDVTAILSSEMKDFIPAN